MKSYVFLVSTENFVRGGFCPGGILSWIHTGYTRYREMFARILVFPYLLNFELKIRTGETDRQTDRRKRGKMLNAAYTGQPHIKFCNNAAPSHFTVLALDITVYLRLLRLFFSTSDHLFRFRFSM